MTRTRSTAHPSPRPGRAALAGALAALAITLSPGSIARGAEARDLSAYDQVIWRDRPIRIHLEVGEETLIRFPAPVQVGVPPELLGSVRTEILTNTVYLMPMIDFGPARFQFRRLDTGSIILFDIESSPNGASVLLSVVDGATGNDEASRALAASAADPPAPAHGYIDYARFAFQSLYAPTRLITPLAGVSERALGQAAPITTLVPGARVSAVPVAEWRSDDGHFITALALTNRTARIVELDPRRVRGTDAWLATAFFSAHLAPADTLGDATTMVVVASAPWAETLGRR